MGSMDEKEWSMARLRSATVARLREFAGRVLKAVEAGRVDGAVHHHGRVTLDVAINVLLDRDERHRERAAQSRKRD